MMQIVIVEPGDIIAVMKEGRLTYYIMDDNQETLMEVGPEQADEYQKSTSGRL